MHRKRAGAGCTSVASRSDQAFAFTGQIFSSLAVTQKTPVYDGVNGYLSSQTMTGVARPLLPRGQSTASYERGDVRPAQEREQDSYSSPVASRG